MAMSVIEQPRSIRYNVEGLPLLSLFVQVPPSYLFSKWLAKIWNHHFLLILVLYHHLFYCSQLLAIGQSKFCYADHSLTNLSSRLAQIATPSGLRTFYTTFIDTQSVSFATDMARAFQIRSRRKTPRIALSMCITWLSKNLLTCDTYFCRPWLCMYIKRFSFNSIASQV